MIDAKSFYKKSIETSDKPYTLINDVSKERIVPLLCVCALYSHNCGGNYFYLMKYPLRSECKLARKY